MLDAGCWSRMLEDGQRWRRGTRDEGRGSQQERSDRVTDAVRRTAGAPPSGKRRHDGKPLGPELVAEGHGSVREQTIAAHAMGCSSLRARSPYLT